MGLFYNNEYKPTGNEEQVVETKTKERTAESYKKEIESLKEKLSHSITVGYDHKENAKKLREWLAVVEFLRKLEDEELVLDITDSEKWDTGIAVGVLDAKTKKPVLALVANGRDKNEKTKFGRFSYYDYVVSKAILVYPKDDFRIAVPKFLLEEVSCILTDHISRWSTNKDKETIQKLDNVLEKLG